MHPIGMLLEKNNQRQKRVAILCPYPFGTAPGQRFRYELFLSNIEGKFLNCAYYSFLDNATAAVLYKKGFWIQKVIGVIKGMMRRILFLLSAKNYDFIFIFRESAPIGPPIFEFILGKILKKKLIYDFDDAIWLPNTTNENQIVRFIKWHSKVSSICTWSYKISCGNQYLADYAAQFSDSVFVIPTVVDTKNYHNQIKNHQKKRITTIGWTGTHSTLKYLDEIVPVLQQLEKEVDFEFLVIADRNPNLPLNNFRFRKWSEETEVNDLLKIDIGIMPLKDTVWERGKCGFKAIQYMALGIPAIVSRVGVNSQIIDNGINGYLCATPEEWIDSFRILINQPYIREQMGKAAIKKIVDNYSVEANKEKFISLFN